MRYLPLTPADRAQMLSPGRTGSRAATPTPLIPAKAGTQVFFVPMPKLQTTDFADCADQAAAPGARAPFREIREIRGSKNLDPRFRGDERERE